MEKLVNLLILILGFVLVGCVSNPNNVQTNEFSEKDKSFKAITYDSNMRSVIIANKNSNYKYCAEPSPDSGTSTQDGISLKASTGAGTEGVGSEDGTSSSSLGGRTGTLLLAREILFRACELGANYNSSYEQQASIFVRALESIEKISDESQTKAPATKAMASHVMWDTAPTADVKDREPAQSDKKDKSDDSDSDSDSSDDSSSDDSNSN